MTIEAKGHVESMTMTGGGQLGWVTVSIRVEGSRSLQNIAIHAKPEEIDTYRIGMPVVIQVRPG